MRERPLERRPLFSAAPCLIEIPNVESQHMKAMSIDLERREATALRVAEIFNEHQRKICQSTDRMFALLMALQWLAGIVAAYWISPLTWVGTTSQTHLHVWAAVFLGGA